jgi:hypothetical protein
MSTTASVQSCLGCFFIRADVRQLIYAHGLACLTIQILASPGTGRENVKRNRLSAEVAEQQGPSYAQVSKSEHACQARLI